MITITIESYDAIGAITVLQVPDAYYVGGLFRRVNYEHIIVLALLFTLPIYFALL